MLNSHQIFIDHWSLVMSHVIDCQVIFLNARCKYNYLPRYLVGMLHLLPFRPCSWLIVNTLLLMKCERTWHEAAAIVANQS